MNLAVVGENIINYEYDHSGIRTAKLVDGIRTEIINDGDSVIAELCQGEVNNYYRGLSLIGYEVDDELFYYRLNAHGDTIGIVDGFGNQVKTYSYDAFGNQADIDEFDINPFRYCGEYFDNETKLIYLRARYYDPSIQRFISEDPICDSVNWYAYCGNNPVNEIDPKGTASFKEKWYAFWYVGPFDAISINNIGKSTLKAAQIYALKKGLNSVTDNIADAYRHFSWNYESAKKGISTEDVMQATTYHEIITQVYMGKDSNGTKYYKVALSSLMDLINNKAGRYQASLDTNKNKSSEEVFENLVASGDVVTSLEQVKTIFGIKDDWLYYPSEGVRNEVSVLIKDGLKEDALNIVVVNKDEVDLK